ncbi:MAG: hypothetical protein HKN09_05735 [Saprospiraceae bacterium]|nr:hypothetical protein [Saprospiraceae bacterium]
MIKQITAYTLLSLVFLIISCKEPAGQTSQHTEIVELPIEFLEFYEQFHLDSTYQMDHIVFPLAQRRDGTKWTKDTWVLHKPFDSLGGEFSRDFTNINGLIIEIMQEKTGTITIERRYAVMNDAYHLIYYSIKSTFGK